MQKPTAIISRFKMLTAALALVLALVGSSITAQAAPGGGATITHEVIDSASCTPIATDPVLGHVITLCISTKGHSQTVVTPSGKRKFHSTVEVVKTIINSGIGVVSREERRDHRVLHEEDGQLKLLHDMSRQTVVSGATTCTYERHYHAVNGKVQFDRAESSCA